MLSGSVNPRQDRSERNVQLLCRGLACQAVPKDLQEGFAIAAFETSQGPDHQFTACKATGHIRPGATHQLFDVFEARSRSDAPPPVPDVVRKPVPQYLEEPATTGSRIPQGGNGPPGFAKRLLQQILGRLGVTDSSQGISIQFRPMLLNERLVKSSRMFVVLFEDSALASGRTESSRGFACLQSSDVFVL